MVENQQNLNNKEANKDNIEDFSVVAQRFLNIFRQLHVFTPERKKAFDDMILAQPSEVRSMFGKLIGGNLLQDYVDELEKKSGITASRDTSIASNKMSKMEVIDTKAEQILAKALETTQKTSQVSNQAQMQQLQLQAQLLEAVKNIPTQSTASFDPKNLEEIVASIMKSQAELITNVTQAQTEQLSKLIAASLQDSYKHSTQSILETIKVMNKDSLETLKENFKLYANNNTPIILSNYNVSNPSGHSQISSDKISDNIKTQEIVYEKAPVDFYYEEKKETDIEKKQPEPKENVKKEEVIYGTEPKTETVIIEEENTIKSEKKKKKKKKNKNKSNNEQFQEQNKIETAPALDYSLFDSNDNNIDINENEPLAEDLDDDLINFDSEDIDFFDLGDVEEKTPAVKQKDVSDKKSSEIKKADEKTEEKKESSFIANISKFIKNAKEEENKQKEKQKTNIEKPVSKVEYLEEKEYNIDKKNDEVWEWTEEESSPENLSSNEEWEWAEEEVENAPQEASMDEGWEWVEEEPEEKGDNEQPSILTDESEDGEWEWVEEEETNATQESSSDEEWEWVEEEPEKTEEDGQPSISTDESEDGEWEWVEEENTPQEASSDEEWEWVEEEPEETGTLAKDSKESEWEWEYEEIPEDDESLVDREPVTFEEEYVEPEGEDNKKPAPISSEGVINQESIFKFNEESYVDVYKQAEDADIPPPSVSDSIQGRNVASTEEFSSIEPEDYWRLEEPENEELMIIESNYEDLKINTDEDDLIEGLETVDNSIFKDEDENTDNLYAAAK